MDTNCASRKNRERHREFPVLLDPQIRLIGEEEHKVKMGYLEASVLREGRSVDVNAEDNCFEDYRHLYAFHLSYKGKFISECISTARCN